MDRRLLDVKDLAVSFETYAGEVQAVRGTNFFVDKGETLAIVGESGCGKSVTAQTIMKLIPMPPGKIKRGSIMFDGKDIVKLKDKEMQSICGSEISMIFQDPMTSLNPTMKIGKQIMEVLIKHQKLSKSKARERAIEMLKLVGLPTPEKRVDQYQHEFSGGMRQRAMIAIALACNPKLLIADEPTTALDVTIQAQVLELMLELKETNKVGILLITHDLGVVADMCDRVIVMYCGRIVESAEVNDLFEKPLHPYTRGLISSVPKIGSSEDELHYIKGRVPDLSQLPKGCKFAPRCEWATDKCIEEEPDLRKLGDNREVRCHLVDEGGEFIG